MELNLRAYLVFAIFRLNSAKNTVPQLVQKKNINDFWPSDALNEAFRHNASELPRTF